eukprot:jgi/Mesen1/6698/ME000343S05870
MHSLAVSAASSAPAFLCGGLSCSLLQSSKSTSTAFFRRRLEAPSRKNLTVRAATEEDDFEAKISKLQRKVTSGTGKKAEERKARKEGQVSDFADAGVATPRAKDTIMLPPVPLKDPVAGGLPVVLGMTPYAERLNGNMACIGLAALILVELASGKAFVQYHDGATIGLQVYAVISAAALFVKYELESSSVWPSKQ